MRRGQRKGSMLRRRTRPNIYLPQGIAGALSLALLKKCAWSQSAIILDQLEESGTEQNIAYHAAISCVVVPIS